MTDAFPELAIRGARVDAAGGDHLLLIVNGDLAFRFPRPGTHGLDLEIKVLAALRPRLSLATPEYDHVDPAGRFGGYRLIAGQPLTPARFLTLSAPARELVVADLGRFLGTLHGLDASAIAPSGAWPVAWTAVRFADRIVDTRLAAIARRYPRLATPIARFVERHRLDAPCGQVVLHGDLVTEHILVEEHGDRLTGIIDFGDVALGDPAQDFLGLWAYGEAVVAAVVTAYGADDPDLLGRSRRHFIRHRIDRLFERLVEDGRAPDAADAVDARALDALLAPDREA